MIWFAPETDTLSVVLGYATIVCWLGAQLPQIVENFQTQSVDGLALPFLVNWLFGDATNLIGCILTDQLPFQKYLASYFCLVDICLVAQFFHYSDMFKSHKKGKEPLDEDDTETITTTAPPTAVPYTPIVPSGITSPQVRYRQIHNAAANIAAAAATAAYEFEQTHPSLISEQQSQQAGAGVAGPSVPLRRRAASVGGAPLQRRASGSPDTIRRAAGKASTATGSTAVPPHPPSATHEQLYEDEDGDEVPAMYESFHSEGGKARDFATWRRPPLTLQMSYGSIASDAPSVEESQQQPDQQAEGSGTATARGRKLTRQAFGIPQPHGSGQRLPLQIDPNAPPVPYPGMEGDEGELTISQLQHRRAASMMSMSGWGGTATGSKERNKSVSRRSATIVFLGVWALFGVGGLFGSGDSDGRGLVSRGREKVGRVWGEGDGIISPSGFVSGHDPPPSSADIDGSLPSDPPSSFIYSVFYPSSFSTTSRHDTDSDPSAPAPLPPPRQPHPPKSPKKPVRSRKLIIGRISAWLCTTLYLTSRLPQIWKNFVRKSVEGLSITLFVAAFLGNLFYVSSILMNPIMNHDTDARTEYLRETIPYLLGSGGTLLFDITIVSQSFIYRGRKPRPTRAASLTGFGGSVVNRRSIVSRRRSATIGEEERLLGGTSAMSDSFGTVKRSLSRKPYGAIG